MIKLFLKDRICANVDQLEGERMEAEKQLEDT